MKIIRSSILLLAIVLGIESAYYGGPKYRYSGCTPQECLDADHSWSYTSCGCVKDGDRKLHGGNFRLPFRFPFGVPFGGIPSGPVFFQGPAGIPGGVFIGQPGIPGVPGGVVIGQPGFPGTPGGVVIGQPGIPGIPGVSPIRCPRTFICQQGQYFNEQTCRCTCLTQQQCFPGQIFDFNTCQCRCNNQQQCFPGQTFDTTTCQCRCLQQTQCQNFQNFNDRTCRCEPTACPNTCGRCEQQNQQTCACESAVFCSAGRVLDQNSCQCVCPNNFCSNIQRLNPQTCRCECEVYTYTFQTTIPGATGPPVIQPGPPTVVERPGTPGTRRTGTRGTRRRGRRDANIDGDVEGPEMDKVALNRQKRRKGRRGPGTRSGPSTRTSTRTVTNGTPVFVPGQVGPPSIITETQQVRICPVGTFQNDATCTCN